ncbi:hypothetical protein [Wolbachia endosymbiont (group B) of Endotricha flammealis]|uniref:hypothetical protein n=1 Tax=Wolbachia endosymbiont (group B) of Endotricha flammealis TaxID=2954005 RepID=UPI0022329BAF|nr:hypothetical protein [Wolbachia endosymbiont (group B) of Endotricha flammealis]
MNVTLKNDKYKESFDSLVRAIERGDVKKIDKQYNKTTNDLSKTFESLTDKAEDIAKYVVRGDLDSYVRLLNKKQSNFKIFRRVLNKISGKDTQIKNISDFVNKLPYSTIETAIEHLNISGKILHHEVNFESRTTLKQKEDTCKLQKEGQSKAKSDSNSIKKEVALSPTTEIMFSDSESHTYEDSGYGSSLDEGHEYEEVSHYQEEKSKILTKGLQNLKLPKEEPIYATIPIEHIEAKRKRKQEQQSKHTVSPKLPTSIIIPEKTSFTGQEVKQESQAIFKDVLTVSSQSKNLGYANQKMSTKPKIVGVTLKKSVESVPLRAENQDYRQVVPKVEVPIVKEVVNCKIDSKVKAIVEKFEQNQVKECADMQPTKSKDIMVAQSGIDMKRNPLMNLVMEQCDRKPCKSSSLTHVNVKQLAAQFESYGKR